MARRRACAARPRRQSQAPPKIRARPTIESTAVAGSQTAMSWRLREARAAGRELLGSLPAVDAEDDVSQLDDVPVLQARPADLLPVHDEAVRALLVRADEHPHHVLELQVVLGDALPLDLDIVRRATAERLGVPVEAEGLHGLAVREQDELGRAAHHLLVALALVLLHVRREVGRLA